MFKKVGDTFDFKGAKYKVIAFGYCKDCAFLNEDKTTSCYWHKVDGSIPECFQSIREDNEDVIFVKESTIKED